MTAENEKALSGASHYFQTVADLLAATRVTDAHRVAIPLNEGCDRAAGLIAGLRGTPNKAMVIGNGGSAALASHTHTDLTHSVDVPTLIFTEASLLTALTNDDSYSSAFAQQIDLWAKPGDLLIAISSSGRSENILRAAQTALRHACQLITLTGFREDNPVRGLGTLNFHTPAEDYGKVESSHAVLLHFLADRAVALKNR